MNSEYLREEEIKNQFDWLYEKIKYVRYEDLETILNDDQGLGKGSFGNVYAIQYEGESAVKQIAIHPGQKDSLFMALDELKFMIKKTDRENIIKIKAFSYKINSYRHITKFYIIMERL